MKTRKEEETTTPMQFRHIQQESTRKRKKTNFVILIH